MKVLDKHKFLATSQRLTAYCLLLFVVVLVPVASAQSSRRIALLIGNQAYTDNPLRNPVNDAIDLAAALRATGFEVDVRTNLPAERMKEAIAEFGARLRSVKGGVGLFYFSGHGIQVAGDNYLLPVGRSFRRRSEVQLFAVEARSVLREMQASKAALNIVILDACRDDPLPAEERSAGERGLARMDAPSGSVIAFSTAPGHTASDNPNERNGLYTKHLVSTIRQPGLKLEEVFRKVGREVERESGHRQSPEEVVKMRSEDPFYFLPPSATAAAVQTSVPGRDPDEEAWALARQSNRAAAYQEYLARFPKGKFAAAAKIAVAGLVTPAAETHSEPRKNALSASASGPSAAKLPAERASVPPTRPTVGRSRSVSDIAGAKWGLETSKSSPCGNLTFNLELFLSDAVTAQLKAQNEAAKTRSDLYEACCRDTCSGSNTFWKICGEESVKTLYRCTRLVDPVSPTFFVSVTESEMKQESFMEDYGEWTLQLTNAAECPSGHICANFSGAKKPKCYGACERARSELRGSIEVNESGLLMLKIGARTLQLRQLPTSPRK